MTQLSGATVVYLLCALVASARCSLRTDQQYWNSMAESELEEALRVKWNLGVARNVILFIGDGMGPNTVVATRIYKGGESSHLSFERFPHVGMLKTYSANKMVADSASTATALVSGVKVNYHTVGVDASVALDDCAGSLRQEARLKSLLGLAQEAGKSTGLVTTMRVTHATPAPLYAHAPNRKWECEASVPAGSVCKDIARQLIEDAPGRDINVIMGGGAQVLLSNVTGSAADPLDTWSCYSGDGRDLISAYRRDKESRGLNYSVVRNNAQLSELDVNGTEYLLGIFANGHLKMEHERDTGPGGMPSIVDMTSAAIRVLQKNNNGFFLMVEGGNIDMAHHRGKAKKAINEAATMDEAVKMAMHLTDERDTLLIVTSDHTHTLSINGYPERGSDVFGIASASKTDGKNYTTLTYATGGEGSFKYSVTYDDQNQPKVSREDPSVVDTTHFEYTQLAAIATDENTHGGGDVIIYARGPHSHLFHSSHEQHYVHHAVCYAARLGSHAHSIAAPATPVAATLAVATLLSLAATLHHALC